MRSLNALHLPASLAVDPAAEVHVVSRHGCRVTETWTDHRPRWMALISPALTAVSARAAHNHAGMQSTLAAVKRATHRALR